MQELEDIPPQRRDNPYAVCVWCLCLALLIGPSALVWLVRVGGLAAGCAPGPLPCHGVALGGGLRDTLGFSWLIGANTLVGLALACIASITALCARRPLAAALSLLVMPLVPGTLPTLAVLSALYSGCQMTDDGVSDCLLWGAQMGESFREAAKASAALYEMVPYSFSLALMVGIVGSIFFRPKTKVVRTAIAARRRAPTQ